MSHLSKSLFTDPFCHSITFDVSQSHSSFNLHRLVDHPFVAFQSSSDYEKEPINIPTDLYKKTFSAVIPCLKNSYHLIHQVNFDTLKYPTDAKEHYESLLKATAIYRTIPPHKGPNTFQGPWIENHYIKNFIDKDLSYFNGFIPLFIQWTDLHVAHISRSEPQYNGINVPDHNDFLKKMIGLLRTDVLYLAVSQDDQGENYKSKISTNEFQISHCFYFNTSSSSGTSFDLVLAPSF